METNRHRWLDLALEGKMRRGGGCLAAFGDLDDRLLLGLSSACVFVCVCVFMQLLFCCSDD